MLAVRVQVSEYSLHQTGFTRNDVHSRTYRRSQTLRCTYMRQLERAIYIFDKNVVSRIPGGSNLNSLPGCSRMGS